MAQVDGPSAPSLSHGRPAQCSPYRVSRWTGLTVTPVPCTVPLRLSVATAASIHEAVSKAIPDVRDGAGSGGVVSPVRDGTGCGGCGSGGGCADPLSGVDTTVGSLRMLGTGALAALSLIGGGGSAACEEKAFAPRRRSALRRGARWWGIRTGHSWRHARCRRTRVLMATCETRRGAVAPAIPNLRVGSASCKRPGAGSRWARHGLEEGDPDAL
jgi:hypothetical protein